MKLCGDGSQIQCDDTDKGWRGKTVVVRAFGALYHERPGRRRLSGGSTVAEIFGFALGAKTCGHRHVQLRSQLTSGASTPWASWPLRWRMKSTSRWWALIRSNAEAIQSMLEGFERPDLDEMRRAGRGHRQRRCARGRHDSPPAGTVPARGTCPDGNRFLGELLVEVSQLSGATR